MMKTIYFNLETTIVALLRYMVVQVILVNVVPLYIVAVIAAVPW